MDDTDHSISQQTPIALPTSQGGAFDYGALDAEKAQALRNAAHAIKNIQRSAIYDLGRHLLDAKKLLEHGQFLRWAAAELGMKSRTAQRAMGAARFMEGKSDTVTLLPAAAIYELSAPSAPAAARDAIVAELENGTPLPVHEINDRLDSARAEERQIQQELARTQAKEQRLTRAEAKDLVAKQQAEREAVAEKNRLLRDARAREDADRIERMKPVLRDFAKTLTDQNLADLLEMLKDEWGRGRASVISILQAEQSLRIAAKDSPIVPTGPDPTEWQNKRDWCLTHSAGLTGTQQDFLAELVPPVLDLAVNLRIDGSATTEMHRDRETECREEVHREAQR
jgi:hypothetical protein